MNDDLLALLDQLVQARAKATPGPWRQDDEFPQWFGTGESTYIGTAPSGDNAALIVAVVNALPQLLAALRGCLRWADQLDREALALGAMQHDLHKAEAAQKRDAAAGIRVAITAALTPEQVRP